MTFNLTKRHIPAALTLVALVYFAGYGVGNLGAKAFNHMTADQRTPSFLIN